MIYVPRKKRSVVEINVINLVDVMMILVIFFVMAAVNQDKVGLDINKPKASQAQKLDAKSVSVSVSKNGSLFVGDQALDLPRLADLLEGLKASHSEVSVVILADSGAEVSKVMSIMDECNRVGVKKISMAADIK